MFVPIESFISAVIFSVSRQIKNTSYFNIMLYLSIFRQLLVPPYPSIMQLYCLERQNT